MGAGFEDSFTIHPVIILAEGIPELINKKIPVIRKLEFPKLRNIYEWVNSNAPCAIFIPGSANCYAVEIGENVDYLEEWLIVNIKIKPGATSSGAARNAARDLKESVKKAFHFDLPEDQMKIEFVSVNEV